MTRVDRCLESAIKLHGYLTSRHWTGSALVGPDPGVRFNYRFGRFLKSYLRSFPWKDNYCYLQAQGYWVLANWLLFDNTGKEHYRQIALRCSEYMVAQQRDDGAWLYPNPEWKGRIANAEGTWGTLGLLESYRRTRNPVFLTAILRWHRFLTEEIKYQTQGDQLAVNYFANRTGVRVPNNSAFVLRFLAELALVTGDDTYRQPAQGLLNFLRTVQQPSGEFPYKVAGTLPSAPQLHFQCFQYHGFVCLDLLRYFEACEDRRVLSTILGVLTFLRGGIADDGHVLYECGNWYREVTYHAAAVAAAFASAQRIGLVDAPTIISRVYGHVLRRQRQDGSFPHSQGDYYFLSDSGTYPRYLSMILYHLLLGKVDMQRPSIGQPALLLAAKG